MPTVTDYFLKKGFNVDLLKLRYDFVVSQLTKKGVNLKDIRDARGNKDEHVQAMFNYYSRIAQSPKDAIRSFYMFRGRCDPTIKNASGNIQRIVCENIIDEVVQEFYETQYYKQLVQNNPEHPMHKFLTAIGYDSAQPVDKELRFIAAVDIFTCFGAINQNKFDEGIWGSVCSERKSPKNEKPHVSAMFDFAIMQVMIAETKVLQRFKGILDDAISESINDPFIDESMNEMRMMLCNDDGTQHGGFDFWESVGLGFAVSLGSAAAWAVVDGVRSLFGRRRYYGGAASESENATQYIEQFANLIKFTDVSTETLLNLRNMCNKSHTEFWYYVANAGKLDKPRENGEVLEIATNILCNGGPCRDSGVINIIQEYLKTNTAEGGGKNLRNMSLKELRSYAKSLGVKGFSKMSVDELKEVIKRTKKGKAKKSTVVIE